MNMSRQEPIGRQLAITIAQQNGVASGQMPDVEELANDIPWQTMQALKEQGISSGEAVWAMMRDPDSGSRFGEGQGAFKTLQALEDRAGESASNAAEEQKRQTEEFVKNRDESAARFTASQKEIADRVRQEQQDFEKFQDKQKLDAEKYKENEAALKNDMGMFTGLLSLGMFTIFAPTAVHAASTALSPSLKNAGDPMLVTSNNDGGMLGAMRNTFGTKPLGQDGLVMGANNVLQFNAGQPLPNASPTVSPTTTPNLATASPFMPMGGGRTA